MSSPQQQVVAVENALSGEKKFRTVHYPLTGDDELDTISGLMAVLNGDPTPGGGQLSFTRIVAVLEYLLARYRQTEHQHKVIDPGFGYPLQGLVGGAPPSAGITPQHYTSGGKNAAASLRDLLAQYQPRP